MSALLPTRFPRTEPDAFDDGLDQAQFLKGRSYSGGGQILDLHNPLSGSAVFSDNLIFFSVKLLFEPVLITVFPCLEVKFGGPVKIRLGWVSWSFLRQNEKAFRTEGSAGFNHPLSRRNRGGTISYRFILIKKYHDPMGYDLGYAFRQGREGALPEGCFKGIVVAGTLLSPLLLMIERVAYQHGRTGHPYGYANPNGEGSFLLGEGHGK